MGFYLRKSFKVGGLRFNLSNSGIGMSTGVKGLRVGIDGKGRSYVSGGVGAIRYREFLDKGDKTVPDKIKIDDIPEGLKSGAAPALIIVLSGLGLVFFSLCLLAMISAQIWEGSLGFFALVLICGVVLFFGGIRPTIYSSEISSAISLYNKERYTDALKKFLKLKNMLDGKFSNPSRSARTFVSEKIYQCYDKLKDYNSAIDFLLQDKDIAEKESKFMIMYGFADRLDEAIEVYEESKDHLNSDERFNRACHILYCFCLEKENYIKALEMAQEQWCYGNRNDKIITCLLKLKDYKNLAEFIQKHVSDEEKEEHPRYYAALGEAFINLNQEEIALECMLDGPVKKRTMNTEMCAFRYTLGKCYEINNDKANALKQYQKVYAYDMEYEDAALKIEELKKKG